MGPFARRANMIRENETSSSCRNNGPVHGFGKDARSIATTSGRSSTVMSENTQSLAAPAGRIRRWHSASTRLKSQRIQRPSAIRVADAGVDMVRVAIDRFRAWRGEGRGERMGRRRAALALAAVVLGSVSPALAGRVVLDVVDRQVLEATDADTVVGPGRVADLLLVVALRDRLAAGDLTLRDR